MPDATARVARHSDLRFARERRFVAAIGGALQRGTDERTRRIAHQLDLRMETLIGGWICLVALAAALKVVAAPSGIPDVEQGLAMSLPFLLLAAAPVLGYRLAAGQFPRGRISAQSGVRLARLGSWRPATPEELGRPGAVAPAGFLVSLMIGILLNVPVRSLEFLAIVPAISPADPHWAHVLVAMMTADAVLMNFAYMACFVFALRAVPQFPRLLVIVWTLDVMMQLAMATYLGHTPGLPVELHDPLATLLSSNVKKVGISVFIWLPYLLVSERVNLTFRHRVRVSAG